MYAATTNDSGDVLAEFCYFEDRECVWVLGTETQCEEGDEYPVLANSSGGARHLVVTCLMDGDDGDHFYGFDWKELEQVVKGERWMGLAFPMRGDAFKVVRFSLDGIDQATEVLDSGFRRALENDSTRPRNTKNEIM
jgi:hypothetical protein